MIRLRLSLFPIGLAFLAAGVLHFPGTARSQQSKEEASWPGFLGPGGIAAAPAPEEDVPTKFGEDGKHVLWKIPSGSGHSSPCVWGRHLFLTSAEEGGKVLVMTAYDRADGRVLWQHRVDGDVEESFGHRASDPAAPTPSTDGERVFFYFGGYGLIARDIESGELAWEKRFPFNPQLFGTGNSPVLLENSIVLTRDGGTDPAIWSFDVGTGEELWKAPRPGMGLSYSSAFVWKNRERTELVQPGTNSLHSYDPEDGRLLWSVGDLCVFPCTTPVGDADRLYFAAWATPNAEAQERAQQNHWGDIEVTEEQAKNPGYLFQQFDADGDGKLTREELPDSRGRDAFNFIDRNKDGSLSLEELAALRGQKAPGRNLMVAVEAGHDGALDEENGVAWIFDRTKALPYVPTPLVVGERIYLVKSGGVVTCLDAGTGKPIHGPSRCGISGEYYASPVAWGERILLCAQRGTVLVLGGGEKLDVLAENHFGEEIHATPAIVDGILYLRTAKHLWAIGREG